MDTSKEYIEMCEKAQEIQQLQPDSIDPKSFYDSDFGTIWLPRQDQLQEMLKYDNTLDLLQYFANFICLEKIPFHHKKDGNVPLKRIPSQWDSMEKIWLYSIMYNLYNKQWSFIKKEWILIS